MSQVLEAENIRFQRNEVVLHKLLTGPSGGVRHMWLDLHLCPFCALSLQAVSNNRQCCLGIIQERIQHCLSAITIDLENMLLVDSGKHLLTEANRHRIVCGELSDFLHQLPNFLQGLINFKKARADMLNV